jgi:hypothetical protein
MAAKGESLGPHKSWQPSAEDAINLSALRLYVLTIEKLSLLIYRSDLPKGRPRFKGLEGVLANAIADLKAYGGPMAQSNSTAQCPDDDDLGGDGLCYPHGSS